MSNKIDGGYAFPHNEKDYSGSHYQTHGGMSLRDYFAGQVLGAYITTKPDDATYREVAEKCFMMADAMIVERDR